MQSRNCASPFFLPPARRGSTNFKTKVQFLFSSFVVFLSFPWCLFFLLSSSSLSFSFANPPSTASASTSTPVLSHTDTRAITGSTAQSSPPRSLPGAPAQSGHARARTLQISPGQFGVHGPNLYRGLQIRLGTCGQEIASSRSGWVRAGPNTCGPEQMPEKMLECLLDTWWSPFTYGTCK